MSERRSQLTAEQLTEVRDELMRLAGRLERSRNTTKRAARPVKLDQAAVGRLSRIDAMQNQHFTKGLQEREEARYAQVQEALRRLDDGRYGLCTGCEEPISFERLLVFPETLRCAGCGPGS